MLLGEQGLSDQVNCLTQAQFRRIVLRPTPFQLSVMEKTPDEEREALFDYVAGLMPAERAAAMRQAALEDGELAAKLKMMAVIAGYSPVGIEEKVDGNRSD